MSKKKYQTKAGKKEKATVCPQCRKTEIAQERVIQLLRALADSLAVKPKRTK